MRYRMLIYADASVIGGCEDEVFLQDSRALWQCFVRGEHVLVLSDLVLQELRDAPRPVRERIREVPPAHQVLLPETAEAKILAQAYLEHGVVGPGSWADALHVATATLGRVDVLVSWNFKHIVNLGKIRQFNIVNVSLGYGTLEIRTPKEVMDDA